MPIDILATLLLTTVIQSIFGVGILLFGTPLLLLLGYDFSYTLSTLLPISIAINTLQIVKHAAYIDLRLYKNVLLYSIPPIIIFLILITQAQLNIAFIIGLFLILVAGKNQSKHIEKSLRNIMEHEKIYLIFMGIIHGLTNLGGSLLTALVHEQKQSKNSSRVTIAICYCTFALFQLLTLTFIGYEGGMSYSDNMLLLQVSMVVFLCAEEFIYTGIDERKYTQLFTIFLALSGLLLLFKSFNF